MPEFLTFEHFIDHDADLVIQEAVMSINSCFNEYKFDFMFEDGENQKSSKDNVAEFKNAIQKAFQSIFDMLKNFGTKLKNFLTGKNLKEVPDPDRTVTLSADPTGYIKTADEIIAEDQSALDKIFNGSLTVDDAKKMVKEHRSMFQSFKPFAATAAAIVVPFAAHKLKIDQWSKDLSKSLKKNRDIIEELAKRNAYSNSIDQIEDNRAEAAQIIIDDIAVTTGRSSKFILGIAERLYVKSMVNKEMKSAELSKKSVTGGIIHRNDLRKERDAARKEVIGNKIQDLTIKANDVLNSRADNSTQKSKDKAAKSREEMMLKSYGYDDKDIKKMRADAKQEEKDRQKENEERKKHRIQNEVRDRAAEIRKNRESDHHNDDPSTQSKYQKYMDLNRKANKI